MTVVLAAAETGNAVLNVAVYLAVALMLSLKAGPVPRPEASRTA